MAHMHRGLRKTTGAHMAHMHMRSGLRSMRRPRRCSTSLASVSVRMEYAYPHPSSRAEVHS